MSKRTGGLAVNPLLQKTETHVDTPTSIGAPEKFTFYFTPEQLERLDEVWSGLRKKGTKRISKSQFVRIALDRLLDEYEKNPDEVVRLLRD